jgi:hypothetical protein
MTSMPYLLQEGNKPPENEAVAGHEYGGIEVTKRKKA